MPYFRMSKIYRSAETLRVMTVYFVYLTAILASTLFATALFGTVAYAEQLYQFALYETEEMAAKDCALMERYYDEKTKGLSFPGHVDKNGCVVSMSHEEYEKRFQFCYLAGVNQHKTNTSQSLECFIQKTNTEYLFLVHVEESMWKESQITCYFTCVGNE